MRARAVGDAPVGRGVVDPVRAASEHGHVFAVNAVEVLPAASRVGVSLASEVASRRGRRRRGRSRRRRCRRGRRGRRRCSRGGSGGSGGGGSGGRHGRGCVRLDGGHRVDAGAGRGLCLVHAELGLWVEDQAGRLALDEARGEAGAALVDAPHVRVAVA